MDDGDRPRTATGSTIVAVDEQDDRPIDLERWSRLAEAVLAAEAIDSTEVSLTFVDESAMAELKRAHLDGDGGPTDVLSFPIDPPHPSPSDPTRSTDQTELVPHLLGDVVICPAVAARQAPDHAGTFDDEVALLLVHGLLHLMGMDHDDDDGRRAMQARERQLLDRLHGPLAADPWRASVTEH